MQLTYCTPYQNTLFDITYITSVQTTSKSNKTIYALVGNNGHQVTGVILQCNVLMTDVMTNVKLIGVRCIL